eukprot:403365165
MQNITRRINEKLFVLKAKFQQISETRDTRISDLESNYNDNEGSSGTPDSTQENEDSITKKIESDTNKKMRKNVLFSCLFSLMMINTLFLNVENILPTWIPDHFPALHAIQISFILSAFEISGLIFSPFIGKNLNAVGRKNTILIGEIIMIISTVALGATQYITNQDWYLYTSLLLRFIQGIGSAQVQTSCYAIITFVFSDNREKYIGMAEAIAGVGLMVGPVIGGFFYSAFGYFSTFFIFGIMLTLNFFIALLITPDTLNKSLEADNEDVNPKNTKKITFKMFLLNKRSMLAFLACIIVCISISYQSAFLTDVLRSEKNIPPSYNGFVLSLPMFTYTVSTVFVSSLSKRIPRRLFIFASFILLSISMLLQGPSVMFGLPDSNWLMFIGYSISGIAQGFVFIPLLPEAIESIYIKEQIVEGENEYQDQILNDIASGLYSTFYSIGQILAPTLGGALYDYIGYRRTCDVMAIMCIIFSGIFFYFNVGFKIFAEELKIHTKMQSIKAKFDLEKKLKQEKTLSEKSLFLHDLSDTNLRLSEERSFEEFSNPASPKHDQERISNYNSENFSTNLSSPQ